MEFPARADSLTVTKRARRAAPPSPAPAVIEEGLRPVGGPRAVPGVREIRRKRFGRSAADRHDEERTRRAGRAWDDPHGERPARRGRRTRTRACRARVGRSRLNPGPHFEEAPLRRWFLTPWLN